MIQLVFGLVFTGLVVTAQAAQQDAEYFAAGLDLLTTRLGHSNTRFLPTVQLGASVVFTRPTDAILIGSGFGSTYLPPIISNTQQELDQSTSLNWQPVNGGDRIYLARHFRVEFNDQIMNITVKSRSALIEYEGLKIKLGPRSSTVVWSKSF